MTRRLAGFATLALALGAVLFRLPGADAAHSDWGCNNCHVPHKAAQPSDPAASWGVPLWNPANTQDGLPTFTLYSSPTFNALTPGINQPDGASKLCLGCHDGSYWVSSIHMFGDNKKITLTESHPISFAYDSALAANPSLHVPGTLKDPSIAKSGLTPNGTIAADLLDSRSKLQCTSCHDVHSSGKGDYDLRFDYDADQGKTMCRTCHVK